MKNKVVWTEKIVVSSVPRIHWGFFPSLESSSRIDSIGAVCYFVDMKRPKHKIKVNEIDGCLCDVQAISIHLSVCPIS